MKSIRKHFCLSAVFLTLFIVLTVVIRFVDVQQIGPQRSSVGLSALNRFIHNLTGVHWDLYIVTDWLGLVPVGVCMGFAALGLIQWIGRKAIRRVDYSIRVLGIFYIVTIGVYLLFEYIKVNYRPVLINGYLEGSYPSSTTLLTMCVMLTATLQWRIRIQNRKMRCAVVLFSGIFTAFMVMSRLISGVHWVTDIIGGGLLSLGLVVMYDAFCRLQQLK